MDKKLFNALKSLFAIPAFSIIAIATSNFDPRQKRPPGDGEPPSDSRKQNHVLPSHPAGNHFGIG